MGLALFDFDGTISSKDSFLLFMWRVDRNRLIWTMIRRIPQIVRFKVQDMPNQRLKEYFLTDMFAGQGLYALQQDAVRFCEQQLRSVIRPGFWQRYEWHKKRDHTLVVVTATPRMILEPWCLLNDMEIIGSELETDQNGRLTGRLAGRNCMGEEKVARIKDHYDISAYPDVYAYGDSAGDLPMLELAASENRFYKPFR